MVSETGHSSMKDTAKRVANMFMMERSAGSTAMEKENAMQKESRHGVLGRQQTRSSGAHKADKTGMRPTAKWSEL